MIDDGSRGLVAPLLALFGLSLVACLDETPSNDAHTSASCGSCHPAQLAEWRRSPHARGTRSPVFAALRDRAREEWGDGSADRCTSCHAPQHATTDESVACISCHGAIGNQGAHDGRLVVDPDVAPMGPTPRFATASDGAMGTHAVRDGELLRSSVLCATCHELTGPRLFVETTGSEHAASWAASTGVECIDCHAPEVDREDAYATGERRRGIDHAFSGVDPAWGGTVDDASDATARAIALLDVALDLEVERTSDAEVVVSVANVGAGHAVPTGVAFLRDLWVDVEITDARGTTATQPRAIVMRDEPMRGGVHVALLTDADEVRHGALAAGEERSITVLVPRGARVRAVLRARAAREEALAALGLEARAAEAPVLDVAEATTAD